ncbi:AraC family transcriptional regulator [Paenibacillus sp. KQZ6P-2]|uniref:AraC family transcriptional regulator n=1 Tax=Paenibacillus mangrovi TaxID=2931978 RepID=A0A9X1WRW1_9BACL|nr:AraC family transcriptional regulator [Paenibacillus mangrovi]MCJ8014227.1 AraC family transcriptional regulator [Paenibacillus mangrovi]
MNINQLFFHIHYCNGRKWREPVKLPRKISRTLSHHELVLVTDGTGRLTLGEKSYTLKEGMLYYIRPGLFHVLELHTAETTGLLTVHFSCTRVNLNDSRWEIADEMPALHLEPAQSIKDAYPAQELFHKLVDCWNAKLPGYEFVSKILLQQLFMAIIHHLKKKHQNDAASLKVEKIIQYMHQHLSGKVTLGELSELVQMAPTYLSRTFKETTGYTVIEFFNKLKIDKAKELLIEGDRKVKEVAQILGFTDEFYFSRMFKRIEGVSPSEFYSKNVHGI